MLENLSYIYQAMYALDLYDSLTTLSGWIIGIGLIVLAFMWMYVGLSHLDNRPVDAKEFWATTGKYQKRSIYVVLALILFMTFLPSKNTLKAYIGVKAVQSVGNYLDAKTDIPERSKASITKLWDKVDGYIESIDIDDEVDKASEALTNQVTDTKAKTDSIIQKVNETAGKENVKNLIDAVKQQAIDSVMATINKQ